MDEQQKKQWSNSVPSTITFDPDGYSGKQGSFGWIRFQTGTIKEVGVNGTTIETVLEALIDRLQTFNRCRENGIAITHLETGLLWLRERTRRRTQQGIEGTYKENK